MLLLSVPCSCQEHAIFQKTPQWHENFSYRGKLNEKKWTYLIDKAVNGEEYYTDSIDNVFVKGGNLHIRCTADARQSKSCSSGCVSTKDKQYFLYGKIEVRAKIQTGQGIFPAIWMLSKNHGLVFPLGEIDIMEYIECFEEKQYSTTIHIVEKDAGQKAIRNKHSKRIKADMKKYHIYGLEWTPIELKFFLDRKEVYRLKKKDVEGWPFDTPYYLIFNVAFGSWGAECGMDKSILPREMMVDWIRYYPLVSY